MKRERDERLGDPDQRIRMHVLGSAGDVSGSLILFEYFRRGGVLRFLLEAGLHQENEKVNAGRRLPKGVSASDISFVIISHAHIDHSGWLPALIESGFRGPVYTHPATKDLLKILLPDSGRLQQAEADRLNRAIERRRKRTGSRKTWMHKPLYTEEAARRSLSRIKCIHYNRLYKLCDGVSVRFSEAAHILGAAVVTLTVGTGKSARTVCFTGNIGRKDTPLLRPLESVGHADYVISESTYGNRLHEKRDRLSVLAGILNSAYKRARSGGSSGGRGVIVIPAFAVGRVQSVLYDLRLLMESGRVPDMPVILDSRMAIAATRVHRKWASILSPQVQQIVARGEDAFAPPRFFESTEGNRHEHLWQRPAEPVIIVGSSGMAAGGKILKHVAERLPGEQNTIIFVGYQGAGALGHELVNDTPRSVRIRGNEVAVRATIEYMGDYSGHADYGEILDWLRGFRKAPKKVFLVHGDSEALAELKEHVRQKLRLPVVVPQPGESFDL